MSWISYGQDGNQYGIYAQRLNVSGEKLGAEFQVNGYTKNNQLSPHVAMQTNGDFMIVWESRNQDGSSTGVYGKSYYFE